jgi:Flp pilus assembly protein TadD
MMKAMIRTTGVALLGLALAGCGGSSGSSSNDSKESSDEGPAMTEQVGTDFIVAELDNTTDDRDAVNLDNKEFSFDDQQAIDALF